jgi:hypothetical protein
MLTMRNFRNPLVKRSIYKIPSSIRKGNAPNLGFRNPEETLFDNSARMQGPSERLFMIDKLRVSEIQQRNWMFLAMTLTLIPIFYMFFNSHEILRKYQVKSISKKRRERLDEEHGIDRNKYDENMQKVDFVYRLTEKEEIEKMRQLGKNPRDVSLSFVYIIGV